jgi:CRISPR-associated protein Cst1
MDGFVGDPFITSGLLAIKLNTGFNIGECPEDKLKQASEQLVELYLTPAWSKELQSIFPNSTYIQSAKNYDKKGKSIEFLHDLIEGLNSENNNDGYCVFCGSPAHQRNDGKPFVKTQVPLIGSSDFTNFFPSFKNGMDLCAKCALAIQFSPLLYYKSGGKPCCISCNNLFVLEKFGQECIEYITQKNAAGSFDSKENSGIFNEGFKNPQNALFNLAYKFINYEREEEAIDKEEIVLYLMDNYNQNPAGVSIYKLPNNVFSFVASVMHSPELKDVWYSLLSKHYWGKKDKKSGLPIWKTNYNQIHDYLLKNRSILRFFRDDVNKKTTVPWILVENYMQRVRNVNQNRINAIKDYADRIAQCITESKKTKRINDLISAKDFPTFKNQLRMIGKDWQTLGKQEPLITFDDYVYSIMPDDYSNWRDVQNLITIRLYEELHPILANTDEEITDIDEERAEGEQI